MNSNFRNRLLIVAVLATTAPLVLTSTTAMAKPNYQGSAQPQDQKTEKQKAREAAQAAREKAAAARVEGRQQQVAGNQQQRQAEAAANQAARQRQLADAQAARQKQARNDSAAANQAARQADRAQRQQAQVANQAARQDNRAERQQAQTANQAARQDSRAQRQQAQVANQSARRVSQTQQKQLIATQKSRVQQYRSWQQSQRTAAQQAATTLQSQKRSAQYAYIQDYNNRLWQQQQRYATMSFNWDNDPYFYSAPSYRYLRDGQYYMTNQYGANILQQAINDGYNEGFHAGRADRMDGWRADYRSSWVYQNASYGYNGYYLDRSEYNYYFRQGFRRGYEDGYYSRHQYGSYSNGNYSIIGAVLNTILGLQPYNRY